MFLLWGLLQISKELILYIDRVPTPSEPLHIDQGSVSTIALTIWFALTRILVLYLVICSFPIFFLNKYFQLGYFVSTWHWVASYCTTNQDNLVGPEPDLNEVLWANCPNWSWLPSWCLGRCICFCEHIQIV